MKDNDSGVMTIKCNIKSLDELERKERERERERGHSKTTEELESRL